MADNNLNTPVKIQAQRIDATLLPPIFSLPYQLYVIQQGTDMGAVAGKANEAAGGAYSAQVRNDEQDIILSDHEQRLEDAEATLLNHEQRITSAEQTLADHESRIAANEQELADHEERLSDAEQQLSDQQEQISVIALDYVSKSESATQILASPIDVGDSYSVNGIQVIGEQQTGWTQSTGTANRGTFNADQTFTISDPPTQSEIQTIALALVQARQRIKALEDMARTHGLIE